MLRTAQTAHRNTVSIGDRLASSDAFKVLFREGMLLVEEAASYLDGPVAGTSRLLSREQAIAYASESMRLTTRLMQLASWLLLQRAVNEGDISAAQAQNDKHKVNLARQELATAPDVFAKLPERLKELCAPVAAPAGPHHPSRPADPRRSAGPDGSGDLQPVRDAARGLRQAARPDRRARDQPSIDDNKKPRREPGFFRVFDERKRRAAYFLPSEMPPKRELNFERRPPRSMSCCAPPVHAGWVESGRCRGSASRPPCRRWSASCIPCHWSSRP